MKIDSSYGLSGQIGTQKVGTTGTTQSQNLTDKVGFSSDEVQFSADGEKVQKLKTNLNNLPDVRQDRVAALKQAFQEGSYNVSSQQVAGAMFSDLLGEA